MKQNDQCQMMCDTGSCNSGYKYSTCGIEAITLNRQAPRRALPACVLLVFPHRSAEEALAAVAGDDVVVLAGGLVVADGAQLAERRGAVGRRRRLCPIRGQLRLACRPHGAARYSSERSAPSPSEQALLGELC